MKILKNSRKDIYSHMLTQMRIHLLDKVASGEINQEALSAWYADHRRKMMDKNDESATST